MAGGAGVLRLSAGFMPKSIRLKSKAALRGCFFACTIWKMEKIETGANEPRRLPTGNPKRLFSHAVLFFVLEQ